DTEHVGAGGADARRDGERALLALRGHREGSSGEQQDEVGAEHERRHGRRVERPRASASAFQYGLTSVTRTLNERAVEDDDALIVEAVYVAGRGVPALGVPRRPITIELVRVAAACEEHGLRVLLQ